MPTLGSKNVVVGINFDGHVEELLDWAVKRVAGQGDRIVAVHVCRNSGCVLEESAVLDGYLAAYKDLCNKKQVALIAQVLKGNSIRKVLVREAKSHSAAVVILGVTRQGALAGGDSVAKYCIKRLPPSTEIMAIYKGKLIFSNIFRLRVEEEFWESDGRDSTISSMDEDLSPRGRHRKGSLSTIALPVEDFTKNRPGWPLLQTSSATTQPVREARKMSVVQWVMNLPRRSFSDVSSATSATSYSQEDSLCRENSKLLNVFCKDKAANQQDIRRDLELLLGHKSAGCNVFSYDLLKTSTCNFSSGNLIGKGGCNSVYKGFLHDGKAVAVKILESSKQARKDFAREIEIMTALNNKRITPLLGICTKDKKLISVYDFVSKGSLEENLHNNRKGSRTLPWEVRFKIALGIAEALHYLHSRHPPVIHRDIKSSNILLTEELKPQLCDFGLAIWGPTTTPFLMDSDIVGTFGYLAPEYFMYGKVSDKIDVYAFGVVLLELLSGRRPIGMENTKGQESLVMWAKPKLEMGYLSSILDPNFNGNIDEAEMQRIAVAAKLCLTRAARLRPKMGQILHILNGEVCGNEVHLQQSVNNSNGLETQDDHDDEVYPDASAESHLNLALLDLNDDECASFSSSAGQSSPLSVEEYLKKRWSRSSSLE